MLIWNCNTSDKDVAYWSIQEDKIMWPAEA
jgi:hypothetical protein